MHATASSEQSSAYSIKSWPSSRRMKLRNALLMSASIGLPNDRPGASERRVHEHAGTQVPACPVSDDYGARAPRRRRRARAPMRPKMPLMSTGERLHRGDAGHRDQRRQERVLDEVLTFFVTNETGYEVLHVCLH